MRIFRIGCLYLMYKKIIAQKLNFQQFELNFFVYTKLDLQVSLWYFSLQRRHKNVVTLLFNSSFFLKLVQCQPRLNREIQPFVVEGVRFNHTWPIPKGFCHFSLFKGHPRPQSPQERRHFRYPEINFPTYIFFKSSQLRLLIN